MRSTSVGLSNVRLNMRSRSPSVSFLIDLLFKRDSRMIPIGPIRLSWAIVVLSAGMVLALPCQSHAQPPAKPGELPKPQVLAFSPAAAPIPALKYRLLPSSADLNPGDAAPIYLRIHGYEDTAGDGAWRQIAEKSKQWRALPLETFPAAEARNFVNLWSGKLKQLEYGTRRKTCDWNYTLPEERLNAIAILLPDAQSMRQWGRVLALKARVEIAEGKYPEAIGTIETGLAFARHVGAGPFFVNGLIGIAIATSMLEETDELIAQRGAPNLYWALTALPRPLIGLRDQIELEWKLLENLIPELSEAALARPQGANEWAALLGRMHEGIVKWTRFDMQQGDVHSGLKELVAGGLPHFKAMVLPAAREHLKTARGLSDSELAAMPDDQVVALYVGDRYRSIWDDHNKAGYLPARDAIAQIAAAEPRRAQDKNGPLALYVQYLPSVGAAMMAELRLDRRVAALRVIEAIRIHAAASNGALPEALNQINDVPIPDDPATGKPFEYHRDGSSATLSGARAGLPGPLPTYQFTIR